MYLVLNRQGSDGAIWMNVIMTCTQAGGMLVYVLVYACAQVCCMMCMTAQNLRRWQSRTIDMIGGPSLRYIRVEPPLAQCTGATVVNSLSSFFAFFGCACSGWPPGRRYFIIYSIFLSSPRDGPSSGTESNLPVSRPTPGINSVE